LIPLSLWTAVAGLPFAVIAAMRSRRDFAYCPAILIGVCVHTIMPDLLQRIVGY